MAHPNQGSAERPGCRHGLCGAGAARRSPPLAPPAALPQRGAHIPKRTSRSRFVDGAAPAAVAQGSPDLPLHSREGLPWARSMGSSARSRIPRRGRRSCVRRVWRGAFPLRKSRPRGVVLGLVGHVLSHGLELAVAKREDAVALLPRELRCAQLVGDPLRCVGFENPHEGRHRNRGVQRQEHVNVVSDAAYREGLAALALDQRGEATVEARCEPLAHDRGSARSAPHQMHIQFRVEVAHVGVIEPTRRSGASPAESPERLFAPTPRNPRPRG